MGINKLGLKPFAGDNYESDMPAFGVLSDEENLYQKHLVGTGASLPATKNATSPSAIEVTSLADTGRPRS
jgi:hypothetical protein